MADDLMSLLQKRTGRVKGPGNGVSDSIKTDVTDKKGRPISKALLSEGEFVIRADVVSNLGGGATDPGVAFLDQFMALVGEMDRETAVDFAEAVLIQAQVALDSSPKIEYDESLT